MTRKSDPKIRAEIDANLRRAYQEIAEEDLPPRFKLLIEQLRGRDTDAEDDGDVG